MQQKREGSEKKKKKKEKGKRRNRVRIAENKEGRREKSERSKGVDGTSY
jgi:hypothetical protein